MITENNLREQIQPLIEEMVFKLVTEKPDDAVDLLFNIGDVYD